MPAQANQKIGGHMYGEYAYAYAYSVRVCSYVCIMHMYVCIHSFICFNCRRNLAGTVVSLLTSSRFPASLVSSVMALQTQIWPQPSVRIDKVLEVIAEVGQPLDGTTLASSAVMTDTANLSQTCLPEEVEVSISHHASIPKIVIVSPA